MVEFCVHEIRQTVQKIVPLIANTDTFWCLHKHKKEKTSLQTSSPCSFKISLARSLASSDTLVSVKSQEVSWAETDETSKDQ